MSVPPERFESPSRPEIQSDDPLDLIQWIGCHRLGCFLSVGVGEIVNSFAPLVGVPAVVATLVVSSNGPGDLGAVLAYANFVALKIIDTNLTIFFYKRP